MAGLPGQSLLHNYYWVLRHGRSIPNETGVIVSSLNNGVLEKYGLAAEGIEQAKMAGTLFLEDFRVTGIPSENVKIFTSPFRRTMQTAETVSEVLKEQGIKPKMEVVEELRERYFGPRMELQSTDHYAEIWDLDIINTEVGPQGGESAKDVAKRIASAITKIDEQVQGCAVLIVSHGDPLQILQTIFVQALSRKQANDDTLPKRFDEAITPFILQQHRKFAMVTGELRRVG